MINKTDPQVPNLLASLNLLEKEKFSISGTMGNFSNTPFLCLREG